MSLPLEPERPFSANDALPPVEPPSAGFIVQLFLAPALIVVIVVAVWLMFSWLAQMGADPESYLKALSRDNAARWQAASSFAEVLRTERETKRKGLADDPRTAQRVADILIQQLDQPTREGDPTMLRIFLCRALGEFNVPTGMPALMRAADISKPNGVDVHRAAIEGIALNVANVRAAGGAVDVTTVLPTVLAASRSDEPLVRSSAAFALGTIEGNLPPDARAGNEDSAARGRLRALANDSYADVRFNAATGLARLGDLAAEPALLEMIDPTQTASRELELKEQARDYKQALVAANGLRAAKLLVDQHPDERFSKMIEPLDALIASPLTESAPRIAAEAAQLRKTLKRRAQ